MTYKHTPSLAGHTPDAVVPLRLHEISDYKRLIDILETRRGGNSDGELLFLSRHVLSLGATHDSYFNYYVEVPKADGTLSSTLWACHSDTVHKEPKTRPSLALLERKVTPGHGLLPHLQLLEYDPFKQVIGLQRESTSNCLGADNGAGIWILLNMIGAGVPGRYAFFRNEEIGRKGSTHAVKEGVAQVAGVSRVICFDRRANTSVITHQMGRRCCSEEFSAALRALIGLNHVDDSGGSYTDSASFMDTVSECTNVSAGFSNEHSHSETLDLGYLAALRDKMCDRSKDWDVLPVVRDPAAKEVYTRSNYTRYSSGDSGYSGYGLRRYTDCYNAFGDRDDDGWTNGSERWDADKKAFVRIGVKPDAPPMLLLPDAPPMLLLPDAPLSPLPDAKADAEADADYLPGELPVPLLTLEQAEAIVKDHPVLAAALLSLVTNMEDTGYVWDEEMAVYEKDNNCRIPVTFDLTD